MTRLYPTAIDVIAIHDRQIDAFGGAPGLRDKGALEASIYRPQTGYYDDLVAEAAALWESLSQNHAFVDGNKRVAMVTTFAFLKVNGMRVEETDSEMKNVLKDIYEGEGLKMGAIETWIRENSINL